MQNDQRLQELYLKPVPGNRKPHFVRPGKCVFLGGPIQYALNGNGFDSTLKDTILSIRACLTDSGYKVFSAHLAEEFGKKTADFVSNEIVERDYAWMVTSEVFIAVLPLMNSQEPYRSDGTHVELGWASSLKKPIVIVGNSPLAEPYTHLVRGLSVLTSCEVVDINSCTCTSEVVSAVERHRAGPADREHKHPFGVI